MALKTLELVFTVLLGILQGNDPINDPYAAAIVAAEVTGLNDRVVGWPSTEDHGATWLVATSMAGTRLTDMRKIDRKLYRGTAIHKIDARFGKHKYHTAVERGWLRPDTCYHHVDDGSVDVRGEKPYAGWSTRGPYDADIYNKFQLMSQYVGTDCFSPALFDIPLFSALAASEYAIATCDRYNRVGRRRPCDWKFLRTIWAGIGSCADPTFRQRVHSKFKKWLHAAHKRMRSEEISGVQPIVHVERYSTYNDLCYPPPRPDER